jgi:hypothetical protein
MKKQNRMDARAKSPDPDDLASEQELVPSPGRARDERPETRPNPDVSEPHLPPPDDDR